MVSYIKNVTKKFTSLARSFEKFVAYVIKNKLNKFIKNHKDPLPNYNCSNVVYKINCDDCDASYVGQTKRQRNKRIKNTIKILIDRHLSYLSFLNFV